MSTSTTKNKPSRLLDQKNEADILFPQAATFEWNGTTYAIKPLPDRVLMTLSSEFGRIMELLHGLNEAGVGLNPMEMLPHLPEILQILLPNATRIVAACLGVDEELVENEMRLGKKVEALRLIAQAEDLPLLVANFQSLIGLFNRSKANADLNAA